MSKERLEVEGTVSIKCGQDEATLPAEKALDLALEVGMQMERQEIIFQLLRAKAVKATKRVLKSEHCH